MSSNEKNVKYVCGYIRVSTDMQTELSPDAQIRLLQEHCKRKGYILEKVYKDIGISGRNAEKRPAFQEMISTCKSKEHPYDAIIVWKFSRFARNQEESIVFKSMLKRNNVEVLSASEDLPDGEFSGLIERIIEWMDEYYSIRLSGEVIRGMTQKALNGGYQSTPPFGYDKKPKQVPTINKKNAKVVQLVFDLFCEGKPAGDIALTLNKSGYRTRSGRKWESRNIWYMIENPFYIGKIRWNNYDITRHEKKTDRERIVVDGQHEPIISEKQFQQANEILEKRRALNSQKGQRTALATKHWLSGTLRCSVCGGTLSYSKGYDKRRGGATPFFQCWKHGKGQCTSSSYINAAKAESMVFDFLRQCMDIDIGMEYTLIPQSNASKAIKSEVEILEDELKRLDDKEKRIKLAYMDGIDTLEEYKYNKTILVGQREEILSKLESERQKAIPLPVDAKKQQTLFVEAIENLISALSDDNLDIATKSNVLRSFFQAIYYDKKTDSLQVEIFDTI